MTKNEIRIQAERIVSEYGLNILDCHNLVERLCDLIEDVSEFDRDTALAGYSEGFVDGQAEGCDLDYDDGSDYDEEYDDGPYTSVSLRI